MTSNIAQTEGGTRSESREPVYYPLDESAARTAHEMKSFREYRSDAPDYRSEVDRAYELAGRVAAEKPERADEAYRLAERFSRKYAEWLNRGYRIDAMCPSVLIAGPAGVPPSKKQRQMRSYDAHMREHDSIKAIVRKIESILAGPDIIKSSDVDAETKLQAKIASLKTRHDKMKDENVLARKEGRKAPHPAWELSNSRQSIRSAEQRLAAIVKQKQAGSSERTATLLGEQVRIVENAEAMRLQLIFDGKPSEELRMLLKRNGFRWSPRSAAWQRQLTSNALFALEIMGRGHA